MENLENLENIPMEEDGQLVLYSGSSGLNPSPSSNNSNSNGTMSNDSPDCETEMDGENGGEEDEEDEDDDNDDDDNDEEEEEQEEEEEEEERVEYSGSVELSPESIQAMAQSIGVHLSEDVSTALGDLAMKKLRAATLLAIGFADHETAPGLRTSDFSKAEQVFQSPSFGHRSSQAEPPVRPIDPGNFCIADEGPEIDLYTTLSSPNISEFIIRRLDPEFYVHQAVVNTRFAVLSSSDDDEEDEGDEEGVEDEDEEDDDDEEGEDTEFEEEVLPKLDLEINDEVAKNVDSDAENPSESPSTNTTDVATVVGNGPTLSSPPEITADEELQDDEELAEEVSSNASVYLNTQYMQLDEDWLEYMRMFVSCFLDINPKHSELTTVVDDDAPENQDVDLDNENTFQCIIEDLTSNSAFPVADVICDFFCDHLNGLFTQVSSTALHRMVTVVDGFLCGSRIPSMPLMRKLSSVLIEILVRPPEYEVQPMLVQVFMKILKNYDELLTWTCTYITEVLKRTSEMAVDLSNEYQCLLYGALLLANGLEALDIKIAHEFGWDSSITDIKRVHFKVKKENTDTIDEYLEEEFNKFEKSNSNGS